MRSLSLPATETPSFFTPRQRALLSSTLPASVLTGPLSISISMENQGMNQGMNQGLNQGLNQGMNQGLNQGLNQGMNQGHGISNYTYSPNSLTHSHNMYGQNQGYGQLPNSSVHVQGQGTSAMGQYYPHAMYGPMPMPMPIQWGVPYYGYPGGQGFGGQNGQEQLQMMQHQAPQPFFHPGPYMGAYGSYYMQPPAPVHGMPYHGYPSYMPAPYYGPPLSDGNAGYPVVEQIKEKFEEPKLMSLDIEEVELTPKETKLSLFSQAKSSMSKPVEVPALPAVSRLELREWFFVPLALPREPDSVISSASAAPKSYADSSGNAYLRVQGVLYSSGLKGEPWKSSQIIRRISNRIIATNNQTEYELVGPMHMNNARGYFTFEILEQFKDGLPQNWVDIISNHAETISKLEPKLKAPAPIPARVADMERLNVVPASLKTEIAIPVEEKLKLKPVRVVIPVLEVPKLEVTDKSHIAPSPKKSKKAIPATKTARAEKVALKSPVKENGPFPHPLVGENIKSETLLEKESSGLLKSQSSSKRRVNDLSSSTPALAVKEGKKEKFSKAKMPKEAPTQIATSSLFEMDISGESEKPSKSAINFKKTKCEGEDVRLEEERVVPIIAVKADRPKRSRRKSSVKSVVEDSLSMTSLFALEVEEAPAAASAKAPTPKKAPFMRTAKVDKENIAMMSSLMALDVVLNESIEGEVEPRAVQSSRGEGKMKVEKSKQPQSTIPKSVLVNRLPQTKRVETTIQPPVIAFAKLPESKMKSLSRSKKIVVEDEEPSFSIKETDDALQEARRLVALNARRC